MTKPEMSSIDFDYSLMAVVNNWLDSSPEKAALLFAIPGIYEILVEEFNNEAIEQLNSLFEDMEEEEEGEE